jgi:heme-degrading monooxygenase HmoA
MLPGATISQCEKEETYMKRRLFGYLGFLALLVGGGMTLQLGQVAQAASASPGYVVVRQYQVRSGGTAEIIRRARSGFVPIISGTPGFRAWYLVDTGKETLMAISIFKDQAGAEESTRRAAAWIKKNLAELMPNLPEIRAGKVVVQKVK